MFPQPEYNNIRIKCPFQSEHGWMDYDHWDAHIHELHPLEVDSRAMLAIDTAREKAAYIYEHYPEARQSNGKLMLSAIKSYKPIAVQCHEDNGFVTITAGYMEFAGMITNCVSIARLGRSIRRAKETGERIISQPIKMQRIRALDAVRTVLEKNPAAFYNEGVLCQEVLRYFPIEQVSCTYDPITQKVILVAPTDLIERVLAHLESIVRHSRTIRNSMDSPHKPSIVIE